MSRLLLGLVFAFVISGAGSARAEKCYPANLYEEYWEQRDILATQTAAERNLMPTPRAIARKWSIIRKGGGWWGEEKWGSNDFEEWSIAYRTDELIFHRRAAWAKASAARARSLEACLDKNKRKRDMKRDAQRAQDQARMEADHAKWIEDTFEDRRTVEQEGARVCLGGGVGMVHIEDCRVLQNGAWVKVGK